MFNVTDGYAEITPVTDEVVVTIEGNTGSKAYDGTALDVEGYKVTGIALPEGASYSFTAEDVALAEGVEAKASQTTVGKDQMGLTAESFVSTNANFGNVVFNVTDGYAEITPQSITPGPDPDDPDPSYDGIVANSPMDVPYSGFDQSWLPTVTDADSNLLTKDVDYVVSYSTDDRTNVTGDIEVFITGIGNFTGTIDGLVYEITPAPLRVTTDSASKVFDGTPLTAEGISVEGFVNGETADYAATGSITDPGQTANTYAINWDSEETTALQSNYMIDSEDLGTLRVYKQSIDDGDPILPDPDDPDYPDPDDPTIPDDPEDPDYPDYYTGATVDRPADVPYNGSDQTWAPTVTDGEGNELVEGEDYTVSYSTDDRTNAGEIVVTIQGIGDFSGTVERTYSITPVQVTVNTQSASKVYDGTPLTAPGEIVTLVNGETATLNTSSITEVGSIANDYEIVWNGTAKQSNYTVVPGTIGTLTITPAGTPGSGDGGDDGGTPTPLPTPDPGTTTPAPTPGTGDPGTTPTPADDATDDATDEAEEAIDDAETPLAASEPIDDDATPMAAGAHRDCWVHWLMLLGILVTVVYYGGVGVRRVRFSSSLQSFEDDVLGNNETNR